MTGAQPIRQVTTSIGWSGHWIAPEPPQQQTLLTPLEAGERAGFSRSLYRRTFSLSEVPDEAPARLTADSRYVLWVNGREVGRGPARSQPLRQRYDEYDLAPHLVAGVNVIAVLVTYYGRATPFWMPAPGGGAVGRDAVVVFEARLDDEVLVSDAQWRSLRSQAWSLPTALPGLEGVPVEVFDARALPGDWREPGFDDSGWRSASVVAAGHIGGMGRSQPPTYPYGRLLPRGISHLTGDRLAPERVLDSSNRPRPAWEHDHPVARVLQVLDGPAGEPGPGELPATFTVGPGSVHHRGVDFGRIVAGFVELDIDAPAGVEVELYYREKVFRPDGVTFSDPVAGARYIARGGPDTFEAVELNGFRYAHLVVHADEEATVTVSRLQVREHLYPHTGGAYFRSSDPALDALYRAGVRTVQLNSFDSYTDCPTREQRAWVGDGVVHQLVDLTTNADWGLARNYVELGNSPRSDGILPMSVVGEIEAGGGLTIPDWSLSWVHGLYNLYWYEGDLGFVRRHRPTVERILRWYVDYIDAHGTISDVPEWNLVDWASVYLTGRSSILTGLWARGLTEFAELSDAVGEPGAAQWARGLYAAAAEGFEDFWDEGRGLYVDHIVDGARRPAASQLANAAAIVSGLAPRPRWAAITDTMTDPERVVVRSWIGGADGGYDPQKMAAQITGDLAVDWDVDREIVSAEPFGSYLVHDAVARAGRAEKLVDLVRRWQSFLVDGYDTFGECWTWGTPVHGWSSTPTRDLVAYVLGLTPDQPGFTQARVAPRPGPLRELAGAVPTPHGLLEARISGAEAEIDSPVPVLVVREDGSEVALDAGAHKVTVR
jgi:alpha-L-rhamnosidase